MTAPTPKLLVSLLFIELLVSPALLFSQEDTRNHALLPELTARRSAIEPVLPTYPEEAVRRNISGIIRIKIEISAEGEILRIKVKPRTNPLLTAAVADAVKQWTFKPWPGPDDTSRPVISRLTFRFTISDGQPNVAMYDPPPTSPSECLGCYNSMMELHQWRDWEEVPLNRPTRKP
jgi:TonB family protein